MAHKAPLTVVHITSRDQRPGVRRKSYLKGSPDFVVTCKGFLHFFRGEHMLFDVGNVVIAPVEAEMTT